MKMQRFAGIVGVAAVIGLVASALASSTATRVTPSQKDFQRIKIDVGLDDRPGMTNVVVIVHNKENKNDPPQIGGWLFIYDGDSKSVAGVPVAGTTPRGVKNAVSYSFALSPKYRANSKFQLSLPPKEGEPEGPSFEVVLGEFERQRLESKRKG